MARLRIGTRGSALARVQAAAVAGALRGCDPELEVEIVVIGVSGDERGTVPQPTTAPPVAVAPPTDKSRWVDRIEQALVAEQIDLAVHSAKDVPGELATGTVLAAAPPREDARDALCGAAGVDRLAEGARVGTGSLRRAAQLRAVREDLSVTDLRGNVDTRLRRLAGGDYDAIVLAFAGLRRLGRDAEAQGLLAVERFVPAPGQGLLALQARADDPATLSAARAIGDAEAMAALLAERALARGLNASCHTPLGAHARATAGGSLQLVAFVGLPDGSAWASDDFAGSMRAPEALGLEVASRMRAAGAGELLARAREMALELA